MGMQVQFHFQWLIGKGASINIYYDPLLFSLHIMAWPSYINIDTRCLGKHLNRLIDTSRSWQLDQL